MRRKDGSYDNTDNIIRSVGSFNDTGSPSFLWDCYDDLCHAVKSLLVKRLHGNLYDGIDDDVHTVVEEWLLDIKARREKGKPLGMKSPVSYAFFALQRWYPTDSAIWQRRIAVDEYDNPDNMISDFS